MGWRRSNANYSNPSNLDAGTCAPTNAGSKVSRVRRYISPHRKIVARSGGAYALSNVHLSDELTLPPPAPPGYLAHAKQRKTG